MNKYNAVITLGTKRESLTHNNQTHAVTDEMTMDVTANIESYAIGGAGLGVPRSTVNIKFSCLGHDLVMPSAVSIDDNGVVRVTFGSQN